MSGPPGREVPQLYMQGPLEGDAWALKGFSQSGVLGVNQTARVTFALTARDFTFFDATAGAWTPYPDGRYAFAVGASSIDLRLFGNVTASNN